jgi:formate hydrogenlyase subunit 4/hydrogenase-4 membrane subunit HyfE
VISISGLLGQAFAILLALVLAPLLSGWVGQCRAWLQSRTAPPLLLPYYQLQKLFHKDVVLAHGASSLFRAAPFVVFGCMVLACAIIPSLSTDLPLAPAADALALVGVFGLARIFISLAAMDVGTSFGSLGGRREMLVGFLAEPALLMVIFTLAMIAQSTSVATIVETLAHRELVIYPSLAFAGIAFTFVSFAENARVPVDNPATHLELTMIHEAMILEYSGPPPGLDRVGGEPQALRLFLPRPGAVLSVGHRAGGQLPGAGGGDTAAAAQARHRRRLPRRHRDHQRQDAHLPRAGIPRHRLHAGGARPAGKAVAGEQGMSASIPFSAQLINLFAAVILLLAFAMLAQRRLPQLINLFALQGGALCLATLVAAVTTGQAHLYYSAGLTLALKVLLLPWILHRLVRQLKVKGEVEALINIPTTMLVGIVLVMVAFNVALPISELSHTITRGTLGIALAVVMLAFLMMITRQKAITQVVGFLSMENGLFLAATSATYGMPMVVELGIALDVLIGVIILGVFFFQIRDQFDSLDIRHMERLKDN